jgi:hypothetical protein
VVQLIRDMLKKQPGRRPCSEAVLTHLYFWNSSECLKFLTVVYDLIKDLKEDTKALNAIKKALSVNKASREMIFEISSSCDIPENLRDSVEDIIKSNDPHKTFTLLETMIEEVSFNFYVFDVLIIVLLLLQGGTHDYHEVWAKSFPNFLWHVYFSLRSFKATHPRLNTFYTKLYEFDKPISMKNYLKRFRSTTDNDDEPKIKRPRKDNIPFWNYYKS